MKPKPNIHEIPWPQAIRKHSSYHSLDPLTSHEADILSGASHVSLLQDEGCISSSQIDADVAETSTSNRSSSFASYAQEPVDSSTLLSSRVRTDKELLSPFKDPIDFKHALLKNLNNGDELALLLMEEKVGDDIVFLQHHDTRYLILGADDKLNHPGTVEHWEETDYIQLEYKNIVQTQKTQSLEIYQRFSSDLPKQPFASEIEKVKGDFFLPLGWLVETNKKGTKRATRYVCILNISTKPLSLWLMFDYIIKNNKGKTINIPDLTRIYDDDIYGLNPGFCTMTSANTLIGSKDLLLVYKDVADWDPSGSDFGTITDSSLLKNLSFHLGPSTQAIGVVPPKSLLDHVITTG